MRQAGLSQIPLSMGSPVAQAGLSAEPMAEAPAPMVTMADRSAIVGELAGRGLTFEEIQAELAGMGLIAPQEVPQDLAPPQVEEASIGDVIAQGGRQALGAAYQGLGVVGERVFGMEGATQQTADTAATDFGLTPEEQQARAARAEDQGYIGEVADAAAGSLPSTTVTIGGGVLGGIIGGAVGSSLGPAGTFLGANAGRKFGALIGGLLPELATGIGGAIQTAAENGEDINDPATQERAMAVGLVRGVLEMYGIERLGGAIMGPAVDAAQRSVMKAVAAGGTKLALTEAASEVAGEVLETAVFDPEIRELMGEEKYAELAGFVSEKYGRDWAVGAGAGVLVGGGIGAPLVGVQQSRINAARTQDVETLAAVAEEGGVGREQLQAAAQDPQQVPALAQAARDIGAARRDVEQAQTILDAASQNDDPELVQQAQERYRKAVENADATYDRVMVPFGAMSASQIETRKEQAAQRAREILVEKDLIAPDVAAKLDRQTVGGYAAELANAEAELEAAKEAMNSGQMYDAEKRTEAQKELVSATNRHQKVKDDIAIRTGRATPQSIKADAKARQEREQYDAATERQYARKFEPLMSRDPEAARAEAERIIEVNKSDADKGLNVAIRKLETKLDKASTVDEITAIEVEIADKRSRLGRQPPIVAAARRVLDSVGPRQEGAGAQGTSPAPARQSSEPTATTATATPATPSTAPASAPTPVQGQTRAAPARPAGAATPPPEPVLPKELSRAAPRYGADQLQFTRDIDRAAYITAQKNPSKRDADFLRFVMDNTGMSPDEVRAHGAKVRAAIKDVPSTDGVRRVPAIPQAATATPSTAPASAPTPEPTTAPTTAPTPDVDAALQRLRDASAQKLVGDAEDAMTAAPEILRRGRSEREILGLDPDTPPGEAYMAGMSRAQLSFERDLQSAARLPIGARPSEMQRAVTEVDKLFTPPAPTREQAQTQGAADAQAAATQARLDRQYATSKAPDFSADMRSSTGPGYTDMLGAFGRRTATAKQAKEFVAENGAKTGFEYYVAIDRETGEVIGAGTNNQPDTVTVSKEALRRLDEGRAVDIYHNHPAGSTLSSQDLIQMYMRPGALRITAVAPDGATYMAEPTALGREVFGDKAVELLKAATATDGRQSIAQRIFDNTLTAWVQEGVIETDPRNGMPSQSDMLAVLKGAKRATIRGLALEGLMRYTETGPSTPRTTREQAAYERGVKNARKAVRDAYVIPAQRRSQAAGAATGRVQRPRGVRSGRQGASGSEGRDTDGAGAEIAEDAGFPPVDGDPTGRAGERAGRYALAATEPLPGAPTIAGASGPDPQLVAVADAYAQANGIDLRRQAEFVTVDPERAQRIAQAYEAMPHNPTDPNVREAYQDLIRQTVAQYRALEGAGYQFYFFDPNGADPYAGQPGGFSNPWNAMRDLRANKRMAVFPTSDGFGTSDLDVAGNPLLADTGIEWAQGAPDGPLVPVTANDLFRAVHDAFGHGLEGAGFRARGEENAWQAHVRLFNGPAVAAITSETRGQNSWLNYGPHGEANRTASVEDMVFADQKTGLMPEWTWQEGRAADKDGFAEDAPLPEIDIRKVRRGQGAGRQHPRWHDASAELPETMTSADAVAEVLRRGADGKEHAIALRSDGRVLGAGTNRASNAVANSDQAMEYLTREIAPINIIHNHPLPSPLSFGDISSMAYAQSPTTITAVLPDGSVDSARLTDMARAMPSFERGSIINIADTEIRRAMPGWGDTASIARASALNRALAQAGVIEYSTNTPDPTDPNTRRAIDAAVQEIREAYPAFGDTNTDGRSTQPGGSVADAEGAIERESIRPDRPDADLAPADAGPDAQFQDDAIGASLRQAQLNFASSKARAEKVLQPPAWMDVQTQQGSALKAAIDTARQPGVITKFASFVETQLVNQFAPIRNYKLRKDEALDVGASDMFKAAEMAVNDAGRNEALLYYGAAKLSPEGAYRIADGTIGIHTMLKKLPDGAAVLDWMEYMGARRAQEIRGKGLKTPLTDADIARGLAKETPLFKEVAADWKKFNDANVDFLVDTGRISRALATTLKADAAYVPFYRSEETLEGVYDLMSDDEIKNASFSRAGGSVLSRDPGIKKLTGGDTRKVNNLIENMIRNSQTMIAAGMRNRAANLSFDIMEQAGDVALQPARRRTEDGSYVNIAAPKGAIRMWRKGQEYYILPTTPDAIPVLTALGGLQPERLGGIHAAMAAVGSFFRQSITLSPAFIVRNLIRDVVSTGVLFQGKNLTLQNNAFTGIMSSLRHSASRQAFTAQSGMGDFRFGGTDIGFGKDDILIELGVMKPTAIGKMGYRFRQVVNKLEAAGTAAELANRLAIYDSLIQEGVRPDEAAYQALTITNYSRRGANAQLQMLLPLVPFLNARIQGLSRIWEDAVTKRGKDRAVALGRMASSGMVLAAFSSLLWGWNNGDEERREEYQSEPLYRRLNYHIIYAGEHKFLIPKAFEVGTIFGTVPELLMQGMINGDTSELGSATIQTLVNTLGFNPIPQAFLPALEVAADFNFFTGRPIEGPRLTNLLREDRIAPQTSALAVGLAQSGLGSFTGLSPVQLEHLLAGYGGVAYTSLAASIDTVAGEIGLLPSKPTGVFGSTPVVNAALDNTFRSMFKQRDADPANKWVEDFYTMRGAITQIHRSARAAALTGDIARAQQLIAAAPATPTAYKLVNRASVQMGDLNSAIRQTQSDPKLTPDQKRERLDRFIQARNDLSREVTALLRQLEEQQDVSFKRAAR